MTDQAQPPAEPIAPAFDPRHLDLTKIDKQWEIGDPFDPVATIYLDYLGQADRLAIRKKATPEERLACKRLALSHAAQYVRHRQFGLGGMGGLLVKTIERRMSDSDSDRFMSWDEIPTKISTADEAMVDSSIEELVRVAETSFASVMDLISSARRKLAEGGVEALFEMRSHSMFSDTMILTVTAPEGRKFRFWNSDGTKASLPDWDVEHYLHIVPPYHPSVAGKHDRFMINGATDALIGRHGVRMVKPGPDVPRRGTEKERFFGSGWNDMAHPYHGTTSSMICEIKPAELMSDEGHDDLIKLVRAALEEDDAYVAISGGFRPPYEYPGNLRHHHNRVRGSEDACVWEYATLKAEGKLDGAIIPKWFWNERWLHIYGIEAQP